MIGLFNIFGSYLFGVLGGHFRQKWVLAANYAARAVVIALFMLLPLTGASAIAFGAGIGFLWLGTVPLTSGLVARVFGVRYLSMLYGVVFASHQLGAFLGAWGGGYAYDVLGSYDSIWLASIALAVFAALIHLPIRDQPVARLREAMP
jgi:predicted MFS family arabinose efflux permease